jgi:hypothetical protein
MWADRTAIGLAGITAFAPNRTASGNSTGNTAGKPDLIEYHALLGP